MLHSHFFDSAANQPDSPALWVDERLYSYREIETRVRRLSAGLAAFARSACTSRCLLFAYRSVGAYVGILGILDAGMAYVPLNPKMPAARIAAIIRQSGAPLMLVDRRCAESLDEVLSLLDVNANVDLGLDLAAPVDLAAAANLNVAAPIEASASANVLSAGAQSLAPGRQYDTWPSM